MTETEGCVPGLQLASTPSCAMADPEVGTHPPFQNHPCVCHGVRVRGQMIPYCTICKAGPCTLDMSWMPVWPTAVLKGAGAPSPICSALSKLTVNAA